MTADLSIAFRHVAEASELLAALQTEPELGAAPGRGKRPINIDQVFSTLRLQREGYATRARQARKLRDIFLYAALFAGVATVIASLYMILSLGQWPARLSALTSGLFSLCFFASRMYVKQADKYEALEVQNNQIELALTVASDIGGVEAFDDLRKRLINILLTSGNIRTKRGRN